MIKDIHNLKLTIKTSILRRLTYHDVFLSHLSFESATSILFNTHATLINETRVDADDFLSIFTFRT